MAHATPLSRAPRLFGRALVLIYRYSIAALIGPRCRHLPSCSEYAEEALDRFGLWAGGWMTLARICRCHPWGTSGLDFVAETLPVESRWYMPWRYGRWRGTNAAIPETKSETHAT
jgi:putative membrane protein insertion efficiency factor